MTDQPADLVRNERQSEEGWCCRDSCCGPGSWCCAHANPHEHPEELCRPQGQPWIDGGGA